MISKLKSRYSAREWAYFKAAYKRTVPFAICTLLLLIVGFWYISNFGKGIWHAFCYIILPVLAGIAASIIFKKLDFQKNLCESSNKVKAAYLGFFTLTAVIFGLMKNPDGFAPSLLLLYIPVVYSMYVAAIPHKGNAKP